MRAHNLAIQIKRRLAVRPQRALLDEPLKILSPLRVNFRCVKVRARWQIDFRFAHVEKAERVVRRERARLLGRHHVVRQLTNLRRQFAFGPQRWKWTNRSHSKAAEDTSERRAT